MFDGRCHPVLGIRCGDVICPGFDGISGISHCHTDTGTSMMARSFRVTDCHGGIRIDTENFGKFS